MAKASGNKNEIGIKYSDKSVGQPEMVKIFKEIKKLFVPYEKGLVSMRGGDGGQVALVSEKELVIDGKKKTEMWFAAALVQKGYVGFYCMPVYADGGTKKLLGAELLNCLKGKTCFHIKKNDSVIFQQIKDALKVGYDYYRKKGWV